MIFVSLGTQDKPFYRLLEALEEADIKDRIVVQAGFTDFVSKKMEIHTYLDKDEFNNYLNEADIIIAHGGVGTITNALNLGKKIIACPRLSKYGEHQNDHQLQIVVVLYKQNYILRWLDGDDIEDVIKKVENFVPRPYVSNNAYFVEKLKAYLDI